MKLLLTKEAKIKPFMFQNLLVISRKEEDMERHSRNALNLYEKLSSVGKKSWDRVFFWLKNSSRPKTFLQNAQTLKVKRQNISCLYVYVWLEPQQGHFKKKT